LRSVSCHVEESHAVSSGIGATHVAQLHERAVLKYGTGNDLAPSAQLQHVLIVDDLQDDFFDSGHRLCSFPTFRRLGPI